MLQLIYTEEQAYLKESKFYLNLHRFIVFLFFVFIFLFLLNLFVFNFENKIHYMPYLTGAAGFVLFLKLTLNLKAKSNQKLVESLKYTNLLYHSKYMQEESFTREFEYLQKWAPKKLKFLLKV